MTIPVLSTGLLKLNLIIPEKRDLPSFTAIKDRKCVAVARHFSNIALRKICACMPI